jgi:gliding motility-associated lipoprotein GldH
MKLSIRKIFCLLACSTFFSLAGCNSISEKFHSFPFHSWAQKDSISIPVDISKPGMYSISVLLRIDNDYQFSNIWINTKVKNESILLKRTVSLTLAGGRGTWLGQGPGENIDNRFLIIPNFNFSKPGTYTITLQQNMRDSVLSGVREVGIRLKKMQ